MLKKLALLALVGLVSVGCANLSWQKGAVAGAVTGAGAGAIVGAAAFPPFGPAAGAIVGGAGGAILGALAGEKGESPQHPDNWQGEQTGSYDEHGVYRGTYSGEYAK